MVAATSEAALRPFVVQITGPLIRIIGDRFASGIKVTKARQTIGSKAATCSTPMLEGLMSSNVIAGGTSSGWPVSGS